MNCWTHNPPNNIFMAAHRGWPVKYPENTVESFRAAKASKNGACLITSNNPDESLFCLHKRGYHT